MLARKQSRTLANGLALLATAAVLLAFNGSTVSAQGERAQFGSPAAIRNPGGTSRPGMETIVPIYGGRTDSLFGLGNRRGMATAAAAAAAKRTAEEIIAWKRSIDYSGPRFGITYLPKAAVDSLADHDIKVGTTITQFGWQLERVIRTSPDGPSVLNEWVFLAGGLESGVFLPSASWLIGIRDRSGTEFGVGPNVSVAGVALAAAGGVTIHSGGLHFPLNMAVASSRTGVRVSFLTGFTMR